jgi:hypothetical protein
MWIESQLKVASSASSLLPGMCAVLCGVVVFVAATHVCAGQTTIASKQSHGFDVSLISKSGELAAKDEYCALFSTTKGGEPTYVEGVFLEFEQQVGKIRESARKFPLSLDSLGRYCGKVDLGKQYYQPAFYYVEVHYTDSSGKRRTCRFFLTLR